MKQRDAVKLMSVIIKYISKEYAAGRRIEEDKDVVNLMNNRSKKRLPRYEEDDELKLSDRRQKHQAIVVNSAEVDPNLFQKPGYNPFELKFRNVNEFPLPLNHPVSKNLHASTSFYNPYSVKYSPGIKSERRNIPSSQQNYYPLRNVSMNSLLTKSSPYQNDNEINQFENKYSSDVKRDPRGFIKIENTLQNTKVKSETNPNMVPTTFRKNGTKSVYPTMINLSYPFVITKMNMQQILIKAKLRVERQRMIEMQNTR